MNTAIKTFLSNHLLENKSAFLAIKDLHPLLEPFITEVTALSIEESTAAFFAELEANIQNWWTNREKDIDVESPLLAIFFEYGDLREKSEEALAFGINKLESLLGFQVTPYKHLGYYDFVDGFYAVPGVTLECCAPLYKLNYANVISQEEYEDIDLDELEGYRELMNVYMYSTYLALHQALQQLYDQGKLNGINKRDPFYFLIQEHDAEAQPLFVIANEGH